MNSKITLLVSLLVLTSLNIVSEDSSSDAVTRGVKHYKCLRVGDLRVCNDEQIDGDLNVDGTLTAANQTINVLTVLGALTAGGDVDFASALSVGGDLIIDGNLIISGTTVINNQIIEGNLIVTGTQFIGGSLNVTGTICAGSFALCPAAAAGTPGVPGLGGDLAYGQVTNHANATVANLAEATFDTAGTPLSGLTFTAGTDTVTVTNGGVYRMEYQVRGTPAVNAPLIFRLLANAAPVANSQFASDYLPTVTGLQELSVHGSVIATLPAAAALQLENVSGTSVVLTVTASSNASLIVERIAA